MNHRVQSLLRTLVRHALLPAMLGPLAAVPVPAADAGCQIVIGSCHRPPLSTPDGAGIIDRLAIEAFRRVGLRACIEPLPCERSLQNADGGTLDGDLLRIPAMIAGKYPNLFVVPEELYALPMSGFTSRADLKAKGIEELAPWRVGHVVGWKILEERLRAAEVLRVRGAEELFALLADNKAEVVIYERVTGQQLVRQLGLRNVRALEPPLLVTPQHLVIHRRHRHLAEPLAAALRAMKADGTHARAFAEAGQAAGGTK